MLLEQHDGIQGIASGIHGIARVELNLLIASLDWQNVKYLQFSKGIHSAGPVEISRAEIEVSIAAITRASGSPVAESPATTSMRTLRGQIDQLSGLKRFAVMIPLSAAGRLVEFLHRLRDALVLLFRGITSSWKTELSLMRKVRSQASNRGEKLLGTIVHNTPAFSKVDVESWLALLKPNDLFVSFGILGKRLDMEVLFRSKRRGDFKVVTLLCDIIPVKMPNHAFEPHIGFYDKYFGDLAWVSDEIWCISEATLKDYEWFLSERNIDTKPVLKVCELGANLDGQPVKPAVLGEHLSGSDFLVYVSTVERRKNHSLLLQAYLKARDAGPVPKLVLVGKRGWMADDVFADIKLHPSLTSSPELSVMHLEGVTDEGLIWLYKNCVSTLYPSLYEGWGLPVAEALALGTPVVASDVSSIPEAAKGHALLLEPSSVNAWAEVLMRFGSDAKFVQDLQDASRDYKAVTWAEFTSQVQNWLSVTSR